MMDFKIEYDVPRPTPVRRGRWCAALAKAEVGASVFLPGSTKAGATSVTYGHGNGWAAVHKVDGGVRVWKIAEPGGRGKPPKATEGAGQ